MKRIRRCASLSVALVVTAAASIAVSSTVCGMPPLVPMIEEGAGWRLSKGCRVYKFGMLTEPDCDILTGEGIVVQITRIRILDLPRGQDNRTTIGIEFRPEHGSWTFSSPYVALIIKGKRFIQSDIDEAIVFKRQGRPVLDRLQPHQLRYDLPGDESRFFRLRFSVPQNELKDGFALRLVGLKKDGDTALIPSIQFK